MAGEHVHERDVRDCDGLGLAQPSRLARCQTPLPVPGIGVCDEADDLRSVAEKEITWFEAT